MSHAPNTTATIAGNSARPFPAEQQHTLAMAPRPSTIMDHDTQVYYFKYFRQFWASGPAAAVAVVAGVRLSHGSLGTSLIGLVSV